MPREHSFQAIAFEENLDLAGLAPRFAGGTTGTHEMRISYDGSGDTFIYPFGAIVFHDVPTERREADLGRLRAARPGLTPQVVREDYTVREDHGALRTGFADDGTLVVNEMTPKRASVIALTVAQSAAMEYYERIVASLFVRTSTIVEQLERRGTVSLRVNPLHRFIGEAIATRAEVLEILHLLDKPDAAWDDPAMSRIYDELRAEFDLVDRYGALESKLRSIQEALELVLDVVRDRRLVLLEATIVILILIELGLTLVHAFD